MKTVKCTEKDGKFTIIATEATPGDHWKVIDAVKTAPVSVGLHNDVITAATGEKEAADTVVELLVKLGYTMEEEKVLPVSPS